MNNPNQLGGVLNTLSDTALKQIKNSLGGMIQGATRAQYLPSDRIAETEIVSQTPSKGGFAEKGLGLLKTLAPFAASFIPGIGGMASKILSTLNDDDWFDEFKGAGASFNELLKVHEEHFSENVGDNIHYVHRLNVQVGVAEVLTDINTNDVVKNEVLSSILAFVRKKTNNVLVDDTDAYWRAFTATARLHAIYYTLKKYVKLGQAIPLNLPGIAGAVPAIQPKVYNQLVGMADALEAYLKTCSGLPYPFAAYLRWRFGTMFASENTGKPALIAYDYPLVKNGSTVKGWTAKDFPESSSLIDAIQAAIDVEKANIAASGRASSDFAVAYSDSGIKYDVEPFHYDEKEYNLRCNMRVLGQAGGNESSVAGNHLVVLDSRLDMNAAIQAVTISTPDVDDLTGEDKCYTLFPIRGISAFIYCPNKTLFTGDVHVPETHYFNKFYETRKVNDYWFYVEYQDLRAGNNDTIMEVQDNSFNIETPQTQGQSSAFTFKRIATNRVAKVAFYSIQMHNVYAWEDIVVAKPDNSADNIEFYLAPLSYDTARVSRPSLISIHRTALRNLMRGEYTGKVEKKELKQEMHEIGRPSSTRSVYSAV
jgi:hypothetical protein